MKIWTLTTDTDEIATTVHSTEQDAFDCLRLNYALDFEGDDAAMVEWLTEEQGVVFYILEHEVPGTTNSNASASDLNGEQQ